MKTALGDLARRVGVKMFRNIRRPTRSQGAILAALVILVGAAFAAQERHQKVNAPTFPTDARVLVLPITGEVEDALAAVVRRVVHIADTQGYDILVLDMNTPGGMVSSTKDMSQMLLDAKPYTITFVDSNATSAGSILAISTRQIFMKRGGTIGSAAPIFMDGSQSQMDPATREKFVGHVRSVARAAAEANGYPVDIAQAFVSATTDIPDLIEKGLPLGLSADQAVKYGIGTAVVTSLDEILKDYLHIPDPRVTYYHKTISERIARYVSSYSVSYLLLVAGLVLAYLEIKTAGFGIFGISSAICFALYFWGSSIAGLAGMEAVILFLLVIIGFVLLAIEVLVIPGFGVFGIVGLVLIMLGLVAGLARVPLPEVPFNLSMLVKPTLVVAAAFATSLVVLVLVAMWFPSTPLWNRLALTPAPLRHAGPVASPTTGEEEVDVGTEGVAISELRPSGIALLDGRRFSVTSEGAYLPSGTRVRVVRLGMHDVYVRRA